MSTFIKKATQTICIMLFALLGSLYAMAQEAGTSSESHQSVSVSKTSDGVANVTAWYAAPWVWIVGGAVFILLLVALVRGSGSGSSSTSVSKTTP